MALVRTSWTWVKVARPSRRTLTAVVAAVALLAWITFGAVATAGVRAATDPVGDSTAPNDVTRIRIDNDGARIGALVRYRDLRRGHLGASLVIDPGSKGGVIFQFMRYQDFDGSWKLTLNRLGKTWRDSRTVRCPGKRATYSAENDRLALSLPRTCLLKFRTSKRALFQIEGGRREGGGVPQEFAPAQPVSVRRGP